VTEALRVGQVAAAAGVNIETLRYYERRGLLARPDRSLGGHRLYPLEAVTQLRVIKTAQRLGFTLTEVADLLEVGTHQHGVRRRPTGLQARAADKLAEVEQRIAELTVIRNTLRQALDAGCDDLLECAGQECCPLPFADLVDHP
jgi:MerR family transcriptional regulator, mercuric resistance operon regulatory protein